MEIVKKKPTIFLWGSCDLQDIILSSQQIISNFNFGNSHGYGTTLDFNEIKKFPPYSPSMMSLYASPGPIALRLYETMHANQSKIDCYNHRLYLEICKFSYLDYLRSVVQPDDVLIVSFSTEILTKIQVGKEVFTIPVFSTYLANPNNMLHWLFTEYVAKEHYQVSFDNPASVTLTHQLTKEFAKTISEIFGERVVCVKTHVTDVGYSAKRRSFEKLPVSCDSLVPLYKQSRLSMSDHDHAFTSQSLNVVLKYFCKCYPYDLEIIELTDQYFVDLDRDIGSHPFHLDLFSKIKIGSKIYDRLIKLTTKEKK